MESNGKRVALDGSVLPFQCGEIVLGEPGTNGQHSFYQLLHQGRVVPTEFIAFCQSPNHEEVLPSFTHSSHPTSHRTAPLILLFLHFDSHHDVMVHSNIVIIVDINMFRCRVSL
jgi:hypothetical protein